jgi:hypothetical protein
MMRIASITFVLLTILSGCNRQDAERLGRVGSKLSTRVKAGSEEFGAKVDLHWPRKEPSLQEKVHDRLRFDKALADLKLEVVAKEKEIELKGTVNEATQKQRAVELAETVAGVERVLDSLTLRPPEEAKPNAE